jgi:hypothetical protein
MPCCRGETRVAVLEVVGGWHGVLLDLSMKIPSWPLRSTLCEGKYATTQERSFREQEWLAPQMAAPPAQWRESWARPPDDGTPPPGAEHCPAAGLGGPRVKSHYKCQRVQLVAGHPGTTVRDPPSPWIRVDLSVAHRACRQLVYGFVVLAPGRRQFVSIQFNLIDYSFTFVF